MNNFRTAICYRKSGLVDCESKSAKEVCKHKISEACQQYQSAFRWQQGGSEFSPPQVDPKWSFKYHDMEHSH